MRNIGLYFGSFNPIHVGHIQVANLIMEKAKFDEVWFVPSPLNPHKSEETLIPAEIRLKWVQMALQNLPQFLCSDVEFHLSIPSFTYKTVKHLTSVYPDDHFELIMGADNLYNFHKWQNANELAEICPLNVYPRPGFPKPDEMPYNAKWFDAPLMEISATQIRDILWQNHDQMELADKSIQHLVPQEIKESLTSFFQSIKP